jgi:hypothetical protein
VDVALQSPAGVGKLRELEHPAGPFEVDRARLRQRERERHGCGGVDDLVDAASNLLAASS